MVDPAFLEDMTDAECLGLADKMLKHATTIFEMERRALGLASDGRAGGQAAPPLHVDADWLADVYDALAEAGVKPGGAESVEPEEDEAEPAAGDDDAT